MSNYYIHYTDVTREILDTIKVGDWVKINDWKRPLRVKAVSKNFLVMNRKQFNDVIYSVCSKVPFDGIGYNSMVGGMFHCGTDNSLFGSLYGYKFDDAEKSQKYLDEFENGNIHLSVRTSVPIYDLFIKSNSN